jgi:hypothetical protein
MGMDDGKADTERHTNTRRELLPGGPFDYFYCAPLESKKEDYTQTHKTKNPHRLLYKGEEADTIPCHGHVVCSAIRREVSRLFATLRAYSTR